MAAAALLVALTCLVTVVLGTTLLRSYLLSRSDAQLGDSPKVAGSGRYSADSYWSDGLGVPLRDRLLTPWPSARAVQPRSHLPGFFHGIFSAPSDT
jgi:hypothetical protein